METKNLIIHQLILIIPFELGFTQAFSSSCNGVPLCKTSFRQRAIVPCCLLSPHIPIDRGLLKLYTPRYLSPLLMPSSLINQPFSALENKTDSDSSLKKSFKPRVTTLSPPLKMPSFHVWNYWYFWLLVATVLLITVAFCGYWRRRKIYESSASQTLSHSSGFFATPTPSEDTPLFGPPLPFLPPAAYPAPPSYSEAARPSYDRLDNKHLYEALLSGRTVYDFYDRRHPNAYYDRYFLPDDTSSSETTSLLSYRLQRSCSAHLPRHQNVKKCHDLPPPYFEVTAKPEMYPVVVLKSPGNVFGNRIGAPTNEIKSTKSMCESNPYPAQWLPPYYCTYRSGSVSTPEGSQTSSVPAYGQHQNVAEWWRGHRGTVSPATLLATCSGIPSPASSSGPLPSEVSSLAPTSPPSPPAPTSPTFPNSSQVSSLSTMEFRDVLHKINQLPIACSPTLPSCHSSECNSPGGMLSPVPLTPGNSPGSTSRPRSCSRGSQTPWRTPSPSLSPSRVRRSKRHLMTSYSVEGGNVSNRPQSLSLEGFDTHPLSSSTSTPNFLSVWPQSMDNIDFDISFPNSRENSVSRKALNHSHSTVEEMSDPLRRIELEATLKRARIVNRSSSIGSTSKRWWESQSSVHQV